MSELEKFAERKGSIVNTYKSGEYLFKEGGEATGVYLVLDHYVRVLKRDTKGNNILLWFANTTELIGLTSFFQGEGRYTCSAVAGDKSCKAIFFSNEEFKEVLERFPHLKQNFIQLLCSRINFMEMRTTNMLNQSIDARLIQTLLFMATKAESNKMLGELKGKSSYFHYSKKELAEIVGTSLEYLRRRVKELKNSNLIDYDRNWLRINDVERLRMQIHS